MIGSLLYFALIIFELFFLAGMSIYLASLLYSGFMGSPYVPSKQKEINYILSKLRMKKGQSLIELGCGDGRFTRTAARIYGVKGLGIDVNPVILAWANVKMRLQNIQNVEFRVQNLWKTDLTKADFIYLFLMPDLLKKFTPILQKNAKKGSIVVSHGFELFELKRKLLKKLVRKPFPTYIYRM